MNRPKFAAVVVLASSLLFVSCNSTQPATAGGGASAGAQSPSVVPAAPEFNACSLFSANDAQEIMGAPMKVSPGTRAAKVCMYEEVTERPNSMGPGRISLTVNKRGSTEEESRGWATLKEVRHLEAGQKNTSSLSGIGDEAWWTGNIEKGKIGVAGVIVRKGSSDFALDSMVIEYVGSPSAMKAIATRVAGQLN
jgi:hypothetical protein